MYKLIRLTTFSIEENDDYALCVVSDIKKELTRLTNAYEKWVDEFLFEDKNKYRETRSKAITMASKRISASLDSIIAKAKNCGNDCLQVIKNLEKKLNIWFWEDLYEAVLFDVFGWNICTKQEIDMVSDSIKELLEKINNIMLMWRYGAIYKNWKTKDMVGDRQKMRNDFDRYNTTGLQMANGIYVDIDLRINKKQLAMINLARQDESSLVHNQVKDYALGIYRNNIYDYLTDQCNNQSMDGLTDHQLLDAFRNIMEKAILAEDVYEDIMDYSKKDKENIYDAEKIALITVRNVVGVWHAEKKRRGIAT